MSGKRQEAGRRTGPVFGLLLALFPRDFRAAFGDEMREVFAAQRRAAAAEGWIALTRLWLRTAAGMTHAAWRERRAPSSDRIAIATPVAWRDIRHAARRLSAARGFSIAVIGTLALCLAANLAIFAVVNGVLLRPLPFHDPSRLVTIFNTYPRAEVLDDGASIANYYERRGQVAALSRVALYRDDAVIVGEPGLTEREFVMRVTPEFFATLGVAPVLGRSFREEETAFGADHVVIVSDAFWRQQFAADPGVVGRTLRVNGTAYTIAGVLPPAFGFLSSKARLFLPLASSPDARVSARRHSGSSSHMVARLADGATLEDAQAQIDAQNAVLERDDPQAAMIAAAGFRSVVSGLQAAHVASVRQPLLLLQAAAFVLLLIGLVNVANLLLVRADSRTREFAVRRAVGARTADVISAVLSETLLLSVAGSAAGLFLARLAVDGLQSLGASRLPLGTRVVLDAWTAAAGAVAAPLVASLLTLAIAWHYLRDGGTGQLHGTTRGGGRHTQRTRHAFAIAQIALSLVLLCGATLLGRGLQDLQRISPGFRSEQVLSGQVTLPWTRYSTDAQLVSFIDRLVAGLRATPGVVAAGVSTNVPVSGNRMRSAVTVLGRPTVKGESPHGFYSYAVGGDYFDALGIPLLEGRALGSGDIGPDARVCVVDEDFARRFWPGGGGIGHRVFIGSSEGAPSDAYTVVGIVGAVKQGGPADNERTGAAYFPYSGRFDSALFVVVRAGVPAESLQAELRRIVRGIDPELPVNNVKTMETRLAESLASRRSPAVLGVMFALLALALTALGTYGVISYAVSQRRREIGVRVALGARPAQVRRQFISSGLRLLMAGMTLGLGGAWLAVRALRSAMADVPQAPAAALLIGSVVIAGVCLGASVLPARRAARISPVDVMRES